MPSLRRTSIPVFAIVCAAAFAGPAGDARAAEGSVALRPGDTFRGTLERCLDRHVAEVELLRGEVFRVRVRVTAADGDAVQLRVIDPQGFVASAQARVRQSGGDLVAGPFRIPVSGTWRFEVSTPTAHGAGYEATTGVRRTRGASAVLRRGGASVAAAAGSTIRLRGRDLPPVSLRIPGDATGVALAPDSPVLAALLGEGLAAPRGGTYDFGFPSAAGRARVTVVPPRAVAPDVVEFPLLPRDAGTVASWQDTAGWVVDATRTAPDEKGVTPPVPPAPARTSPFGGDVVEDCPAPGEAASATLDDPASFVGPASGVGFPAAGIPRLDDVVRDGRVETTPAGPSYVLERPSDLLGRVTTRVWFLVEGRPSYAPLAIDGRVTVRWEDQGGSQQLQGAWTLRYDPVRGVQTLDGAEARTPDAVRTFTTAAEGFALGVLPGTWPQGRLAYSESDPRTGRDFTRTETFDGTPSVTVQVRRATGATESATLDF